MSFSLRILLRTSYPYPRMFMQVLKSYYTVLTAIDSPIITAHQRSDHTKSLYIPVPYRYVQYGVTSAVWKEAESQHNIIISTTTEHILDTVPIRRGIKLCITPLVSLCCLEKSQVQCLPKLPTPSPPLRLNSSASMNSSTPLST